MHDIERNRLRRDIGEQQPGRPARSVLARGAFRKKIRADEAAIGSPL
jgi:hypothetical protein